jgi:hypothetical protein
MSSFVCFRFWHKKIEKATLFVKTLCLQEAIILYFSTSVEVKQLEVHHGY